MRRPKGIHLTVLDRNLGDNALNLAIRRMLAPRLRLRHMELLKNPFDERIVCQLQTAPFIVFGGGGLIHSYKPRGNAWERTGTMWNIHLENLERINTPIVLYGVGYNHFFGEPEPLPIMADFFRLLKEKNALVAFRNDGSKKRFLHAFPDFDERWIHEIPDPGIFFRPSRGRRTKDYILLQIASDRMKLRYGDSFDAFLELLRELLEPVAANILLLPHTIDDERLYAETRFPFKVTVLPFRKHRFWTEKYIRYYAAAMFTISTRGHSQICSIGNGVPSFSIATHPKVIGFADSLSMRDCCWQWDPGDTETCRTQFSRFLGDLSALRQRIADLNRQFDQDIAGFNETIYRRVVDN